MSLLLLALFTAVAIAACQTSILGDSQKTVTVGSKDFTEQFILGEMYALMLEDRGLPVERKLNLGGTPVAQASLTSGQIDLYPEYTGTGLLTVLKQPTLKDPQAVYQTVAQGYRKFNLVWLKPAPMNNTQALVMTQAKAQKLKLESISDLAKQANQLTLIGPPEFEVREDGLPGLQRVYGKFNFKKFVPADPGLRYQALRQGEADVAVGFGTDGEISAFNLVVLKDDKNLFPPYQVAPVVREQTLQTYPEVQEALNQLAPKLNDTTMRRLNYEVSGKQREPAAVAKEFLTQSGLLQQSQ